ncbi:MAG: hypothetical protein HUU21_37540 [Polyangiaceae bacterium]|nr:hypothetical protein [Polyangiaceae bacterium]
MMPQQPLKNKPPKDDAWSAIGLLNYSTIKYDDVYGNVEGDDDVRYGLDAMASALTKWRNLDPGPLDEVLAELGCDDAVVETAARLIELVGRTQYLGGLDYDEVREAEDLRENLVETLDALLNRLDAEEREGSDA